MSLYKQFENNDNFYLTLCFFSLIIILVVLTFCIIMTEIIVYDTWQVDHQTANVIAILKKLVKRKSYLSYYGRCNFKNVKQRKSKQSHKINKQRRKEIKVRRKIDQEKFKIPTGTTVEQVLNLLFEAMLMELKDRNDMKNKLCIPVGDSTDGSTSEVQAISTTLAEPEKTLQYLSLRQNTLAMLIETLSNFTPEILERLVSPDIYPSITYQDILNRLKKLQEQVVTEQKVDCVNEHNRLNKKLMRKIGETEGIILENLINEIKVTEEIMAIVDPADKVEAVRVPIQEVNCNAKLNEAEQAKLANAEPFDMLKQTGAETTNVEKPAAKPRSVEEINCISPTINAKLNVVEHLPIKPSDVKSSDAKLTNAEPLDIKQTEAKTTDLESSAVKPRSVEEVNCISPTINAKLELPVKPPFVKSADEELTTNLEPFYVKQTDIETIDIAVEPCSVEEINAKLTVVEHLQEKSSDAKQTGPTNIEYSDVGETKSIII